MRPPLPVTALTGVDRMLRDATALGVMADVPGVVVVRHDLSEVATGTMRRVVSDAGGLVEDEVVHLDHACLSCALREDLLPTLARLADTGHWQAVLLALPVAGEPVPVVRALALGEVTGRPVSTFARLAGVVCVVDGESAVTDLIGGDLITERYLSHGADDRRSVGEVLAHQIAGADLVLAAGTERLAPGRRARTTTALNHLCRPGALRCCAPEDVSGADLLTDRHDARAAAHWEDPLGVAPTGAEDGHGVWTLDLQDWRPLHPERLEDHLEDLGSGALVGRGRFWLPTRPQAVGLWDGAGGQLSIGSAGSWGGRRPSTRLVVTGIGEDPARVHEAFTECLLTDAELAQGLARWAGRPDGFDTWLGSAEDAA